MLGLLSGLCSAAETADELMKRAHEGRVSWRDFRGFQADVTASTDGKTAKGKLTVESDGTIRLSLRNAEGMEWVEKSLDSVIGHRVSDGAAVQNVEFADEDTHHPLGHLIKSRTANEKSLWRVQGDVMTEARLRHGIDRIEDIKFAILEANGHISIIPRERPSPPRGRPPRSS